jgi:hypothetical protein
VATDNLIIFKYSPGEAGEYGLLVITPPTWGKARSARRARRVRSVRRFRSAVERTDAAEDVV